ncbi:MAG: M42 family metallopeptidase, partial [Planctomycetota bacterium]
ATNTALGRGPCLRVFDNAAIIPRAFTEEVRAIAEAAEIPLQIVFSGGGTDVGPFQAEGPQVMPLGFPLRYTHSAVEMAHKDDVAHMLELVCAIVGHFAGS